jgi:UDP-4-amino-4,6-dideoxy-N-acetyl-beta-L-altrosamine transaminase
MVERFEQAVADYCGVRYAVAVNSATSALHIACLAGGIGKGDVLWTSPNTFVASSNCGLYCGATVDFVDIHPTSYNMNSAALELKLEEAEKKGCLPNVVIPVHFAGQSCEMARIQELSRKYGFITIEDASHAIGGTYRGKRIGSCAYSEMTVFSFHPVKIMTTGEGGMVVTNRIDLYEMLLLLRSHGITRNSVLFGNESHGPWYYQQLTLGFNYRMTDIQAALGVSQMRRLDAFVARRRKLAERYHTALADLPLDLPAQHPDAHSAYHLYVLRLHTHRLSKSRKSIFEELQQAGIGVSVHYIPVHTQPFYQDLGFCYGDFPNAERYYEEAITIPLYYGLSEQEQDYIIEKIRRVVL